MLEQLIDGAGEALMMWRMVLPAAGRRCAVRGYRVSRRRSPNGDASARRTLKREGGWLTVAGLFWLHEGANTFGKDPGNEIVLPDGPAKAGVFELQDGKVTVKMDGVETRTVARFAGRRQGRPC